MVSHTGYHNETYRSYWGKKLPENWFKPAIVAALPFGLPALDHNLADVRDYFVNNIIDWIEDTGDRMKAAALVKYVLTFQFTTRGIPQVYYGTEAGLEGEWSEGGDHFLRREMPWEKIDPHTHEPFPVYRAEKMIYDHLRKLIAL